jgi:rod shape-determining protein MreC
MNNALYILTKYGYHLLFFALEFTCIYLIINFNPVQKSIFVNSTNLFTTYINNKVDKFYQYGKLKNVNDSLQLQNERLIEIIINSNLNANKVLSDTFRIDSFIYKIKSVDICNSTVHLQNNFITLCQGSNNGLKPDMGVITDKGIVGIINRVSPNYSNVVSILNKNSNISCSIKRNNAAGNLKWNGEDPKTLFLEAIPKHISVNVGDTVITNGFSTIFPKGIMVGRVKSAYLEKGNNNYTIKIDLSHDPVTLNAVYVIFNEKEQEQNNLESLNKI